MSRLRYLTAGESHGPGLTAIVEGCPAGLALEAASIDADLRRRQGGYGRGDRQRIERDAARIMAGVRHGRTTGAPVALFVANRDADNWGDILAVEPPASGEDHGGCRSASRVRGTPTSAARSSTGSTTSAT